MGFAACTNEVEEFNTQSANVEATDLGKDFVIGVTKSGFNADAETRAALSYDAGKWIAAWGKDAEGNPDAIGAAWFNKSKWDGENYVSGSANIMYIGGEYASNNKFVHQEGNIFKSEANSKTGAYVLYYPFDESITNNMATIPVKPISENKFDCNEIEKYVNQNIFAASVANFKKSGTNAPSFTIEQIPVLYAISFYIKDQNMLTLGDKIEITHVMVEATKDGKPAINTDGIIQPEGGNFVITNDQYKGLKPMPKIEFVGEVSSRIDRMMIAVENSNDEYCIRDLGVEGGTKNFYFSMLPTEEFDKVTFKVVAKIDGKKTVVLAKSQDNTDFTKFSTSVKKMAQSGQVVNLGVGLDHVFSVENGIYTEEQFIEYWKAGEVTEFDIQGPGIDLSDNNLEEEGLDFTLPEDKAVKFTGMPITLPTINGNYAFGKGQKVTIKGDATLKNTTTKATTTDEIVVSGNLDVEGGTKGLTIKKATVGGKLTTKGKVAITNASDITSSVTITNGTLSLPNGTKVGGGVTVNYDSKAAIPCVLTATGTSIKGTLSVKAKAEAVMKGTWSANAVTVNGKLSQNDIKAQGTVFKKFTLSATKNIVDYPELQMTAGSIDMGSLIVNDGITSNVAFDCQIGSTGEITANSPVTFNNKVESAGNINATADVTFNAEVVKAGNVITTGSVKFSTITEGVGNIAADNDVIFNGSVKAVGAIGTVEKPATGKIQFIGNAESVAAIYAANNNVSFKTATITGTLDATNVKATAENLTVNGKINLKEESALTTPVLIANNIDLDVYSQLTANTNLNVTGKLNAKGKVNAENTSSIADLYIEPNVVVDLATAKINKLNVAKKLTYVGKLNAAALTITEGENNGVINATTSTTVNGEFTQKATLNSPSITVAMDEVNGINGILNVEAEMSETIINNGTVNVNAKADNVENNGILNLIGTATVLNKTNGVVNVSESGILNLSTNNEGTIYVKNTSKVNANTYDTGTVVYVWEGTNKPVKASSTNNILLIITKLEMVNAQVSKLTDLTSVVNLNAISIKGNYNIPTIASTSPIAAIPVTVDGEATIDAYDSDGIDKKPVNVTISNINVPNGAKFNITEYIKFQTGTTIKLGGNNTINGNIGDATYTNM